MWGGSGEAPPSQGRFQMGFFLALPGPSQTVPRAELFGLLLILRNVLPPAAVCIVTDSLTTCNTFQLGAEHHAWRTSPNADLWELVWPLVQGRALALWIKAHAEEHPEYIDQYQLYQRHVVGNVCADVMAGRGAALQQVSTAEVDIHRAAISLVSRIQTRCVAILQHHASVSPRLPRQRQRRLPQLGRHTLALMSPHSLVPPRCPRDPYVCLVCGPCPYRSPQAQISWFLRPCKQQDALTDPVLRNLFVSQALLSPRAVPSLLPVIIGKFAIHSSHVLWLFQNVFFCRICGARVIAIPKLLRLACTGPPPPARAGVLARLLAGELPWGFLRWPARVGLPSAELLL